MKRGTPEHPKTRILTEKLAAPTYAACGILELLWHMTARYAPRGDIGRFSDAAIADHLDWKGNPELLVAALVDSGWLERDVTHRLIIHDWKDHCEQSAKRWCERNKVDFVKKSVSSHVQSCPEKNSHVQSCPVTEMTKNDAKEVISSHVQSCPEKNSHVQSCSVTEKGVSSHVQSCPEKNSLLSAIVPLPLPQPCVDSHAEAEGEAREETEKRTTPLRKTATAGQADDGRQTAAGGGEPLGDYLTKIQDNREDGTDMEEDARRAVEGDEAHKVLKERPELRNLRYEQDLAARKDWACFEPKPDWVEIAHWVSVKAVLAGHVNEPGSWLLAQYRKWFDDFQKKNGTNGVQRSGNPLVRMFRRMT